jgi:hypothetical protein
VEAIYTTKLKKSCEEHCLKLGCEEERKVTKRSLTVHVYYVYYKRINLKNVSMGNTVGVDDVRDEAEIPTERLTELANQVVFSLVVNNNTGYTYPAPVGHCELQVPSLNRGGMPGFVCIERGVPNYIFTELLRIAVKEWQMLASRKGGLDAVVQSVVFWGITRGEEEAHGGRDVGIETFARRVKEHLKTMKIGR